MSKTNEEFVADLMQFSPTGALIQVFVIEAISKYAEAVAKAPPIEHVLINGEAWKRTAEYIVSKVEEQYGRRA